MFSTFGSFIFRLQLLALFEVCAHPHHSTTRSVSAIQMLDSIIRSLSLTVVDADDPDTSVFVAGEVPRVPATSNRWSPTSAFFSSRIEPSYRAPSSSPGGTGCNCNSLTLGKHWPSSLEHTPLWATTPAWDPAWSEADIRKESSRRLCWAAISLAAGHVSYAFANNHLTPDLFIADPGNVSLHYGFFHPLLTRLSRLLCSFQENLSVDRLRSLPLLLRTQYGPCTTDPSYYIICVSRFDTINR